MVLSSIRRACSAVVFMLLGVALSTPAAAQLPAGITPQQLQQMSGDPAMVGRLQQMVQSSGLTPEQLRQRLRAQGYPDDLLDQYMPGATPDSAALPSQDVFAAVRALGIGDSTSVDSLSAVARSRTRRRALADSAFLDTLQMAMKNDSTRNALHALIASRHLQRQQLDSGFTVFGLALFDPNSTLFDAPTTGAVDANYRFGPGDQMVLFLTGDVERSYRLSVTREGFIVIPDVGAVNVAGLTRNQLEDALYDRLSRVYSGVRRGPGATTRFYIDVSQVGASQVYVTGDVKHPASYRVSRAGTIMTALYMAGGPTANGSMRDVELRRNGQTVAKLDVYDYALHGNASNDVRLENGDIVFVPARGPQVRVAGEVLRPATYEIAPNQTVADAIAMAGGFRAAADQRSVQIHRIVPPAQRTSAGTDRRIVDVPSDLFATAPVLAGDVIEVHQIAARVARRVEVKGNVWTPGAVALTPGLHLSQALRQAGGLKPDSYLGEVQITRLLPDSSREMLRTAVYDTTGRPVDDLQLQDGDDITVFSTASFRPNRYITIGGSVRKPGRIPYRDGMTLRDAVLLANGLAEGALLTEAEIARLPETRAAGVTAVTQVVPLDSTYLFTRRADGTYIGPPGIPAPTAKAPDVPLRPYDAILIKQQPDWELQRTVLIAGEVRSPGEYTLTTKSERLTDVLKRAGGLTSSAYPDGMVLVRSKNNIGRIGVDLASALRNPASVDNVELVDGDSIYIPQFTSVVTIRGAVNAPVAVAYVPGADIDYYVLAAGGATSKGDFGRSYVMQPNGRIQTRHRHSLFWISRPTPRPGSTVTVPLKDPNANHDWGQIVASTTSILGSLVAIAAIVKR
ncbi:MAG TPA: SLBB domain-containing protein [Gemmatimonadaceae bacterium]|nr:SLBB domain-containing protein [Gemmatimonadaceae bacterium]